MFTGRQTFIIFWLVKITQKIIMILKYLNSDAKRYGEERVALQKMY